MFYPTITKSTEVKKFLRDTKIQRTQIKINSQMSIKL